MRGSYSTLSGCTPDDTEDMATLRQAQHAVFGLQPDSDHGVLESETYSTRANSAPLPGYRRPPSAAAHALGVNAHTLKNALLARSAVLSAGTWVEGGATGAPAAFYRHAAIATQYANTRMVEEQQQREVLEKRLLQMDARRGDERALAEQQSEVEQAVRKEAEAKRLNKEVWLGAAAVKTREKKQWEEGMSPMERAINRGLLQKMKHYDRQRASSAPTVGRFSPERRYSSHGALLPEKWL
jgi:hypothetical protein